MNASRIVPLHKAFVYDLLMFYDAITFGAS